MPRPCASSSAAHQPVSKPDEELVSGRRDRLSDLVSVFAGDRAQPDGPGGRDPDDDDVTYLGLSLLISAFMNWYNAKMALVERGGWQRNHSHGSRSRVPNTRRGVTRQHAGDRRRCRRARGTPVAYPHTADALAPVHAIWLASPMSAPRWQAPTRRPPAFWSGGMGAENLLRRLQHHPDAVRDLSALCHRPAADQIRVRSTRSGPATIAPSARRNSRAASSRMAGSAPAGPMSAATSTSSSTAAIPMPSNGASTSLRFCSSAA